MIDALLKAVERAKAAPLNAGTDCHISPDWEPTTENIHALPEPLRRYIMLLQTRADPALDTQLIWHQRELIEALKTKLLELKSSNAEDRQRA